MPPAQKCAGNRDRLAYSSADVMYFLGEEGSDEGLPEGERPAAVSQRWEAVFRRERMPDSIDRSSVKEIQNANREESICLRICLKL